MRIKLTAVHYYDLPDEPEERERLYRTRYLDECLSIDQEQASAILFCAITDGSDVTFTLGVVSPDDADN